jgi:adenylyltransferase/sulfurtransferase
VSLDKTLIYGSILGFEGCGFNHRKRSKNLRDLRFARSKGCTNCNMNGVLGTLPGMIGTMMAHETLKVILELPCLRNELVLFQYVELAVYC